MHINNNNNTKGEENIGKEYFEHRRNQKVNARTNTSLLIRLLDSFYADTKCTA